MKNLHILLALGLSAYSNASLFTGSSNSLYAGDCLDSTNMDTQLGHTDFNCGAECLSNY
jgi:hypothetical protein